MIDWIGIWGVSTLRVLIFVCIFFLQVSADFAKLNTQNFPLNCIRKNKYALNMPKFIFSKINI